MKIWCMWWRWKFCGLWRISLVHIRSSAHHPCQRLENKRANISSHQVIFLTFYRVCSGIDIHSLIVKYEAYWNVYMNNDNEWTRILTSAVLWEAGRHGHECPISPATCSSLAEPCVWTYSHLDGLVDAKKSPSGCSPWTPSPFLAAQNMTHIGTCINNASIERKEYPYTPWSLDLGYYWHRRDLSSDVNSDIL